MVSDGIHLLMDYQGASYARLYVERIARFAARDSMVQGYGDAYRHGLADWHAIIDGLAKPTFDACCR